MSAQSNSPDRVSHVESLCRKLRLSTERIATATVLQQEAQRELEAEQNRFQRDLDELRSLALSGPSDA